MGFGHRVYKVRDPRADVLAAAAERLFTRGGDMSLYDAGARGRGDGAAAARGVQAGPPAADQRRVLHRAAAARPRTRRRRSSRRPSPSAASAAGSRTRSSSAAPTASSARSRSTPGPAIRSGCRLRRGGRLRQQATGTTKRTKDTKHTKKKLLSLGILRGSVVTCQVGWVQVPKLRTREKKDLLRDLRVLRALRG